MQLALDMHDPCSRKKHNEIWNQISSYVRYIVHLNIYITFVMYDKIINFCIIAIKIDWPCKKHNKLN